MIPPIASRFIAGDDDDGALDRARSLNERDVGAILNRLGEHYVDPSTAAEDTVAYIELLERIDVSDLRACVSVKPSQVGVMIDEATFRGNAERIADAAVDHDGFVWFDMEDHSTTDATVDVFHSLADSRPGRLGVCLQANLTRTRDDLERLSGVPGKVRLVKGAYDPPSDLSIGAKEEVNDVYADLLEYMFRTYDDGIAVGTHDPAMIEHAIDLHDRYGTGFEIQMLMGVREDALFDLAADYEAWQYVPFGGKWASYFSRRVTERTDNLLFALRAILGR